MEVDDVIEKQAAWMTAAQSFISQQESGTETRRKQKQVRAPRHAAMQLLCALDKMLCSTIGKGLDFCQAPVDPGRRTPVLTINMDEHSVNWNSMYYLCYEAKLFVVPLRDIFHREWNDVRQAVSDQGHAIVCSGPVYFCTY